MDTFKESTDLPIMADTDKLKQAETSPAVSVRYYLVIIPIVCYCVAEGVGSYVLSEWIHAWVKTEIYPNSTFSKGSKCAEVNTSAPDYVIYKQLESDAATWLMYNSLAVSVPGVMASYVLPSYSDILGRRFLFVIVSAAYLIKCVMSGIAIYFNLSPVVAICASFIEGISGTFYLLNAAVCSYIADCTKDGSQRTVAITIMDGIQKFCYTLAGLTAGYYISWAGYLIPMCTCLGLISISMLLSIFVIPESHPKAMRTKSVSIIINLRRTVDFYTSHAFRDKRAAYILLIIAYFLSELTSTHRSSIELIYQLGRPFCWSYEKIGMFSAARHATQGLVAVFLVKPLKRCFSELQIAVFSTSSKIGSYVLEGLARTNPALYTVPLLATFANIGIAMIKSKMSMMTPPDKQGALFASIFAVFGVCGIIAPFLMNALYAHTVSLMNGLVFLVLAGVASIALAVLILFWATKERKYKVHSTQPVNE